MKTYTLYIKSHTEAPDFEAEIDAIDEADAIHKFDVMLKGEFSDNFIRLHMKEEL